jgi:glycosyltransferase involved in cell wall biosynthesis
MRVAMVSPRYRPHRGGVETHVASIAERLTRDGWEVDVYTTDPHRRLLPVERINGVTVRRFPAWAPHDAYYVSPSQLAALRRQAEGYDLIHAHSYQALTCLNGALAAGPARPFIFTPHYHGQGETAVRNLLHLPWRIPGRWLFRVAKRVICVSAAELQRLHQRFPHARAIVIPNGINLQGLGTAVSPQMRDERVVLCVGRLERYKNVDRLISAAQFLPEDCRVTIVGNGPYKPELLRALSRTGIEARVHIESDIDDAELLQRYRTCSVCVNLSSSEAFGLTLLEALGAGKPVVANDIPAFREIGELSGLIQLVHLQQLDDRTLASTLTSAMQLSGEPLDLTEYSWDEVARRTREVYCEVLREVHA